MLGALGGGGLAVSGSAESTASLKNYVDTKATTSASGFHAPIINLAMGGSTATPQLTDSSGNMQWIWIAAIAACAAILFFKKG